MTPEKYLKDLELWDLNRLKQHAQHNSVYVIESKRFPGVIMLHYMDSVQYDSTWNTFNRMCRGLILDIKNQKVLAYPFDKFFNLGAMPETKYENLVSLGEFQTSEKLDGSMIITFIDPNTDIVTFTTKGSFDSEHGKYANCIPMTFEQEEAFRFYAEKGTLMFELIAKPFQIVVDYKKKGYTEGLYLIGYRHKISNKLASFSELFTIANKLSIPTFKTYSFSSLDQLIETAKGLPVLEEGYVLRFPGDLLVKVKGTAYLEMHRFVSQLSDRNILEAVANKTDHLLIELCPEEFRDDVIEKVKGFKRRVVSLMNMCYNYYALAPQDDRKTYAIWCQKNVESYLQPFMFTIFEHRPLDLKRMYKVIEEVDAVKGVTRI